MGTQLSSNPKNPSLSQKFTNIQSVAKLWNRGSVEAVNPETLPTLPIATLEGVSAASVETAGHQAAFDAELALLKDSLLQARRSAILARSQSVELAQRQELCRKAQAQYEGAQTSLRKLGGLARRLDMAARRKFRALEGALEWRAIRHTIQRSAEMNQLQLAFAA